MYKTTNWKSNRKTQEWKAQEHDRYAGFWVRVASLLIDYSLISFFMWLFVMAVGITLVISTNLTFDDLWVFWDKLAPSEEGDDAGGVYENYVYVAYIPITIFYHTFCEISPLRGSIGKFALRAAVLDENGQENMWKKALVRNILAWVFGICTLSVSHWFAGFSKKKQALHDMVTGCVIVHR